MKDPMALPKHKARGNMSQMLTLVAGDTLISFTGDINIAAALCPS